MNSTANLRQALRDRYPPPEWVLAFEVQAERDEGGLRFADAIAFDTRKTAGLAVHGFEMKVSRADWLQEVRHPGKSVAARGLVDYWWLVLGDAGIALEAEVPSTWGILEVTMKGLETRRSARRISAWGTGNVVDRGLIAALLRRFDPMEPHAYWEGRERRAEEKGYAKGRNAAARVWRARDRRGTEQGLDGPLDLP